MDRFYLEIGCTTITLRCRGVNVPIYMIDASMRERAERLCKLMNEEDLAFCDRLVQREKIVARIPDEKCIHEAGSYPVWCRLKKKTCDMVFGPPCESYQKKGQNNGMEMRN